MKLSEGYHRKTIEGLPPRKCPRCDSKNNKIVETGRTYNHLTGDVDPRVGGTGESIHECQDCHTLFRVRFLLSQPGKAIYVDQFVPKRYQTPEVTPRAIYEAEDIRGKK